MKLNHKNILLSIVRNCTKEVIKQIINELEQEIKKNTIEHSGYKYVRVTHLKLALKSLRAESLERLDYIWSTKNETRNE